MNDELVNSDPSSSLSNATQIILPKVNSENSRFRMSPNLDIAILTLISRTLIGEFFALFLVQRAADGISLIIINRDELRNS